MSRIYNKHDMRCTVQHHQWCSRMTARFSNLNLCNRHDSMVMCCIYTSSTWTFASAPPCLSDSSYDCHKKYLSGRLRLVFLTHLFIHMTKQVIMLTQLLLLQVFFFLSVNAVPQAAQSSSYIKFSFRAVSVGTSSLGQKYLGASHIAAAEDVAVLKTPQEKYCYFYLKDENLV